MDDQRVGGGDIEAGLHDRGGEQHVELPVVEARHDVFELGRRHAAVCHAELHLGHGFPQEGGDLVEVGDAWHHIETLAAAEMLAEQALADDDRVEGRNVGAHRQSIERRCGNQRQLAHAGECQLQGAGNGRRGQRQHMHVGAHLLQPLLVLDAKVLLLVDDHQAEVTEFDRVGQQRVGADHDVHVARGDAGLHLVQFLLGHHAGGLGNVDGQALEASLERGEVLARQKRGWHHHRHLLAVHRRDEGRAQRHLGLAEAHVTADQAIHRASLLEVLDHRLDGGQLVLRLLVGEARREFFIGTFRWRKDVARLQLARRCGADQPFGDLEDALLELCLLGLPRSAAELVELRALLIRAVARQEFDILDRQEQPITAGIGQEQAVMWRALNLDDLQPLEAADAVVHVNDEVPRRQCRKFADEVGGLLVAASAPHHAITKNVLLGDDGEIIGLKTLLQPQHDEAGDGLVPCQEVQPVLGGSERRHVMVLENGFHALARTFGPRGDGHPASAAADIVRMGLDRLIDIAARLGAFGDKAPPAAAAEGYGIGALEGREGQDRIVGLRLGPLRFRHIERRWLHRFVGCRAIGFLLAEGLAPRIVEFCHLFLARRRCLVSRVVESDNRVIEIVEER